MYELSPSQGAGSVVSCSFLRLSYGVRSNKIRSACCRAELLARIHTPSCADLQLISRTGNCKVLAKPCILKLSRPFNGKYCTPDIRANNIICTVVYTVRDTSRQFLAKCDVLMLIELEAAIAHGLCRSESSQQVLLLRLLYSTWCNKKQAKQTLLHLAIESTPKHGVADLLVPIFIIL